MPTGHSKQPEVFISYSHRDQRWLEELLVQLKPLKGGDLVDAWSDQEIRPGQLWQQEIAQALSSCKVAVLLVTPAFLASSFITETELPSLLAAAANRGLTILWIPFSASNYKHTPLAGYHACHDPERPLDTLGRPERQEALVRICERILAATNAPVGGPARDPESRAQHPRAHGRRDEEDQAEELPATAVSASSPLPMPPAQPSEETDFPILRRSRLIWAFLALLLGLTLTAFPLPLPLPETPIAEQLPFLTWRQLGWAGLGTLLILCCAIRYPRETFVNKAADQLTDLVLLIASGFLDLATHWRQNSRRWAVGLVVAAILIFPVALLAVGKLRSHLDRIGDISALREKLLIFACYGRLQGGNEAELRVLVKSYFLPERLSTTALRDTYRTLEELYKLQNDALNDSLEIRSRRVLDFWRDVIKENNGVEVPDRAELEADEIEDRLMLLALTCRAHSLLLTQDVTAEQSADDLDAAEKVYNRLKDSAAKIDSEAARRRLLGVARNGLGTLQVLRYRLIMSQTDRDTERRKATFLKQADEFYQDAVDLKSGGDQSDEAKHRRDNNDADLDTYLLHESLGSSDAFVDKLNARLLRRYLAFKSETWNAANWVNDHAPLEEKARFARNPIFFLTLAQLNGLAAEKVLHDNTRCRQELQDPSASPSPLCSSVTKMLRNGFLNLTTSVYLGQPANGLARDPEKNFLCIYFRNPITAKDTDFLFTRMQTTPDLRQCS